MTRVTVIGLWHLGCVTAACLAELGCDVVGFDRDAQTVSRLAQGDPPLFEPGLAELAAAGLQAGRLRFTADLRTAVTGSEFVWLTSDTPINDRDEVDLSDVYAVVEEAAPYLAADAILLISSQVPVGTCEVLQEKLQALNPHHGARVAYIPENLRLGHALERFRHPAMLVIGANDEQTSARVQQLLAGIETVKLPVNLRTAEMTKHAINAFLATSISFANEIGNLCDRTGADATAVARVMRFDERIGPKARLDPGLGFAGGTLARDLRILQALGERSGYETALVDAVLEVNARQNRWVARTLRELWGSVGGRRIGVLGLTYTPNTSTLRRSAAIEIIQELHAAGATVHAYDPKADPDEVARHDEFSRRQSPYEAAEQADCLVVLTDWTEFRDLDFARLAASMRRPLLLDAKNMLDESKLKAAGFDYIGIGRGVLGGRREARA